MDSAQLNGTREVPSTEKKKGISGSTVKLIAIITMLIDHIGAAVLARVLMKEGLLEIAASNDLDEMINWMMAHGALYYSYMGIRMVGRLGFPIFAFLLVEGFQKTSDVRKYAFRMVLFALVSEIPFDLAFKGQILEFGYQNVYFTLFLGLFALCAYEFFAKYRKSSPDSWMWMLPVVLGVLFTSTYAAMRIRDLLQLKDTNVLFALFGVCCVIATVCIVIYKKKRGMRCVQIAGADMIVLVLTMYLADLLKTDYAGMGVLTITAMYIFRKNKVRCVTAGCVVLTIMSISEIPAFLAIIPIALYNGRRGLKMKYFFYAFYPVHLFLLYLISMFMGLGNVAMF